MAGFRFLHCADIHLDSPLRGLSAYPGAPVEQIRGATRQAFAAMVAWAEEQRVDFVVVAGDLYDGDWKDFQTGLYFTQQMARLGRAGIRVYVVMGNHDAQAGMTKALAPPANVTVLSHRRPQSVAVEGLDAVVHGQSFARRDVADNLAASYPPAQAGAFNIGLLHTALSGRDGHDTYAPCSLEQLVNHGYQYWALGHVHAREVVHRDPWVVFPGNLQGRNIRESGAKGATLVTVRDGAVSGVEALSFDVLRWATVTADLSPCRDRVDALARVRTEIEAAAGAAEGRALAVRLHLEGVRDDPDQLREEIRAVAQECGEAVWVEKVVARAPAAARSGREDAVAELLATLDALAADPATAALLAREVAPLMDRLPPDLRPALGDTAAVLAEAEALLLAALDGPA